MVLASWRQLLRLVLLGLTVLFVYFLSNSGVDPRKHHAVIPDHGVLPDAIPPQIQPSESVYLTTTSSEVDSSKASPSEALSPILESNDEDLVSSRHPIYKDVNYDDVVPVVDNFPLAVTAKNPFDLPPIPSWNKPPLRHVPEKTPLFIGFTRNWLLLQQALISYMTAGWPPEDIFVFDNTGTMSSNRKGLLSLQNPFFMNHTRLADLFNVNIITTPTLLSFSQLQNFYLSIALDRGYEYFFWSHMDVVALSGEDVTPYKSLYMRCVETLRQTIKKDYAPGPNGTTNRWGTRLFSFDQLALVNVTAYDDIGGWDTLIPYYGSDCDMYERLRMEGYKQESADAGLIYDVGSSIDDLEVLYRRPLPAKPTNTEGEVDATKHGHYRLNVDSRYEFEPEDSLASPAYYDLKSRLETLQREKNNGTQGRNYWQARQAGGQGEPYYRDPDGFDKAIQMTINHGRDVFSEKWGHKGCKLQDLGLSSGDAWIVEHDWDGRG